MNTKMKKMQVIVAVLLLCSATVCAQSSVNVGTTGVVAVNTSYAMGQGNATSSSDYGTGTEEYHNALLQLFEVSGMKTTLISQYSTLLDMLKNMAPSASDAVNKIGNKYQSYFIDSMIELSVPIYMKYFTIDEIREYIAFYDTPLGKKIAITTPLMSVEMNQAGQKVGKELSEKIISELGKM